MATIYTEESTINKRNLGDFMDWLEEFVYMREFQGERMSDVVKSLSKTHFHRKYLVPFSDTHVDVNDFYDLLEVAMDAYIDRGNDRQLNAFVGAYGYDLGGRTGQRHNEHIRQRQRAQVNIVVRGNSREFPGFLRAFISNFVDGRSPEDIEDIMDRHRFMDLTYDLMDISALTVHNFFMDLFDAIESVWMEEGPRDIKAVCWRLD